MKCEVFNAVMRKVQNATRRPLLLAWMAVAYFSLFTLYSSLLTSCGSDRQTFLLEGTFKGFNQGELYIYGVDGSYRLDTISVVKGVFRYEVALEDSVTLALVFPNFSELPIFAEPQAEVEIVGDASHLKETKISGTEMNEAMTSFRMKTSQMTPPEAAQAAEAFIRENPASPISLYILNKYFTQVPKPDYKKAVSLITELRKAQPDEPSLKGLAEKMKGLENLRDGATLPSFTARDINGKTVSSTVVGICVDADQKGCRQTAEKDSVKWSIVNDGKMWESPLVQKLGLSFVPDNIMTDSKGKVIAHTLRINELQDKARPLLDEKSP